MALKLKFLGGMPARLKATPPANNGAPVIIEGYASTFGNVDAYGDVVQKGAFARTLINRAWPVAMFYDHFLGAIGRWVDMGEDDYGLRVRGELTPGSSVAADVAAGIRHGAISGLSIGFNVPDGGASIRDSGAGFLLTDVDLIEISCVDLPANTLAEIDDVRDFHSETYRRDLAACASLRELERVVRRHFDLPRNDSTELSNAYKRLTACELATVRSELDGVRTHGDTVAALRELERIAAAQ